MTMLPTKWKKVRSWSNLHFFFCIYFSLHYLFQVVDVGFGTEVENENGIKKRLPTNKGKPIINAGINEWVHRGIHNNYTRPQKWRGRNLLRILYTMIPAEKNNSLVIYWRTCKSKLTSISTSNFDTFVIEFKD